MPHLFLKILNRDAAAKRNRPDEILKCLNLREGQSVADIGAGGGYFTMEFARRVGPSGRVYAVDVRLKILDFIRSQATQAGLGNVVPVLVRRDDFLLPENGIDLIFLRNVYHHLPRPVDYFKKLRHHLREDGRIAVVDFRKWKSWVSLLGHYIDEEQLTQNMKMSGYRAVETHDFLPSQSFHIFRTG